jgi:hypothetical protein
MRSSAGSALVALVGITRRVELLLGRRQVQQVAVRHRSSLFGNAGAKNARLERSHVLNP